MRGTGMRLRLKRLLTCIFGVYVFGIYFLLLHAIDQSSSPNPAHEVVSVIESRQVVKKQSNEEKSIPETTTTEPTEQTTEKLKISSKPRRSDSALCPELSPPTFDVTDRQKFLPVGEAKAFYAFSAFVDRRFGPNGVLNVVSIGDTKTKGVKFPKFCQVWYRDEKGNVSAPDVDGTATLSILGGAPEKYPEGHGLRYIGYNFQCSLRSKMVPYAVSLALNKCDPPPADGVLKVLSTQPAVTSTLPEKPRLGFAVCVTPLNLQYDDVNQLVEMVEMNRELGAEHFTFYNHSIGPRVSKVLKHYINVGIVDLVQWPIPIKVNVWPPVKGRKEEIHYFGQVVALNDCRYRYMNKADITIMTDMDEFIVPRIDKTWKSLLGRLGGIKPKVGAYLFKNTFFRTEWPNEENLANNKSLSKFNLLTQLKTKREKKVNRPRTRSKYFAITERVRIVGIHYVWKSMPGYRDQVVPEETALLHHYRNWENPNDKNWILDRTMHKYTDNLLQRVQNIHRTLT